jgi:hypothetical protein
MGACFATGAIGETGGPTGAATGAAAIGATGAIGADMVVAVYVGEVKKKKG